MAPANRLQALLDVSHKLSSTLELSEVLRAFTDQATELTGATAAEISFWDHERDELIMLVEYFEGANEITEEGCQIYRLVDLVTGVATGTGAAPGRVDSPPTSRISAPSSSSRNP